MKHIAFLFLFISLVMLGCKSNDSAGNAPAGITRKAPANELEKNIYRSADSMMAAFKRKDYETFARYNHPAMMKMMGGSANFVAFIKEQMKSIPDTAIKVIGAADILQVVKTANDQQCVVSQQMQMILEGIEINTTTYLVGESLDEGKSWTFFDASSSGLVTPKDIKPDISPELVIPAQKKDVKQLQ